MRRRTALFVPLALAACTPNAGERVDSTTAPAAVAAPAANVKADEDSIRAINRRWQEALVSRDSAAIAALFADDGSSYPIDALFRLAKDMKTTFESTSLVVAASGDVAAEHGTFRSTWTDAAGKAFTESGNYVTTWKKVAGQWKVLDDIAAREAPLSGK